MKRIENWAKGKKKMHKEAEETSIIPICIILEIQAGNICSISKSFSPLLHPLHLSPKPLFMANECFSKSLGLFSDITGNHIKKYWKKSMAQGTLTAHDLHKLIKAPTGRSIVFRENDNVNSGSLNSIDLFTRNVLSSWKPVFISKGVNSSLLEGTIEVVNEVLAGVFTTETKEDIMAPTRIGRG